MMGDMMTFPDSVEQFMEQYKIVDTEKVYTNGTEMVPIFRMKQWFEHEKAQLSQEGTTSDTISRQAALEKVRTMQTYKLFEGDDMILVDKADVQTELMMLPSAQPEPQWIPVERELPEPRIDVWVNSDLGQMTGYYDETVELWYGRDYLELIVNAWMPLPAPYQKGAKD